MPSFGLFCAVQVVVDFDGSKHNNQTERGGMV